MHVCMYACRYVCVHVSLHVCACSLMDGWDGMGWDGRMDGWMDGYVSFLFGV